VILQVNYEELRALSSGAELVFAAGRGDQGGAVAAPPESVAQIEALQSRLTGDLSIASMADHRRVRGAMSAICDHLRERLESKVIEFNPGHEEAVDLHFDYAHAVTVLDRLDRLGTEMRLMIEVMTERPEIADSITFPD
jgi:hypothetical protein